MLNSKKAEKVAGNVDISGFLRLFAFFHKKMNGNLCKNESALDTPKVPKKGGVGVAKTKKDVLYENIENIEKWASLGISQKKIASLLGMGYTTFRDLKKEIPALSALLDKRAENKNEQDAITTLEVVETLEKRCKGYNVEVKKVVKLKNPMVDKDGNVVVVAGKVVMVEELKEVTEEQHVPGDINGIKFYLANVATDEWNNDPARLELDKKRVANDTKRTKIAEAAAKGQGNGGKTVEDILEEMEAAEVNQSEEGAEYGENI